MIILLPILLMVLGLILHFAGKDGKVSNVGFYTFWISFAAFYGFLIFTNAGKVFTGT